MEFSPSRPASPTAMLGPPDCRLEPGEREDPTMTQGGVGADGAINKFYDSLLSIRPRYWEEILACIQHVERERVSASGAFFFISCNLVDEASHFQGSWPSTDSCHFCAGCWAAQPREGEKERRMSHRSGSCIFVLVASKRPERVRASKSNQLTTRERNLEVSCLKASRRKQHRSGNPIQPGSVQSHTRPKSHETQPAVRSLV